MARRFAVALSFPGERRTYVERVARALLPAFGGEEEGKSRIFYDAWHESRVIGYASDRRLQSVYQDSDLIVPFYCQDYLEKEWCGVELRVIEARLLERQFERVLPFRFDMVSIPGSYKTDIFPVVTDRAPEDIARLIIERYNDLDHTTMRVSAPTSTAVRRFNYRATIKDIIDYYTQRFVGRDNEIALLTAIARSELPGYHLVQAPAGYGKTALLAHMVRRHDSAHSSSAPLLVCYFIRTRGQNNTSREFLRAINGQLLAALGLERELPVDLDSLHDIFKGLWSQVSQRADAAAPLLLIVDSLDEMATGDMTIADVLPGNLAPYVHVIVSSRPNPDPRRLVQLEHPLRSANTISLGALRDGELRALLEQEGVSADLTAQLAPRIAAVTGGHPLFARFVCQDVADEGTEVLVRLESKHSDPHGHDSRAQVPERVREYFGEQFMLLESAAGGSWEVLGLLQAAIGSMSPEEIAGVLGLQPPTVHEHIKPIRRFLLGTMRVELMHAELAEEIGARLGADIQARLRKSLLKWCQSYEDLGWPDHTPKYVVLHYAAHLRANDDRAALYGLMNRRWMYLHLQHSGGYQTFANDLEAGMVSASSEQPPKLLILARGCLLRGTLGSRAAAVPSEVLGVLAATGRLTEACAVAALTEDPVARFEAYRRIVEALVASGVTAQRHEQIVTIADQALAIAQDLPGWQTKAETFASLAPSLVRLGWDRRKLFAAGASDDGLRLFTLKALARAFREAGDMDSLDELMNVASAITTPENKAEAVVAVAVSMARVRNTGRLDMALTLATEHPTVPGSADLISELVKAGKAQEALRLIARAGNDQFQADYLLVFALAAGSQRQVEALESATDVIVQLDHAWSKANARGAIARGMAQAGQSDRALQLAQQALIVERQPGWAQEERDLEQLEAEAALLLLSAGEPGQALATIEPIQDHDIRERVSQRIGDAAGAAGNGVAEDSREEWTWPQRDVAIEALAEGRLLGIKKALAQELLKDGRNFLAAGEREKAVEATTDALAAARDWYAYCVNGRNDRALACIATAMARANDTTSALNIASRMRETSTKRSALQAIAEAAAEANDFAGAWSAAQRLPAGRTRDEALNGVVARAAHQGAVSRAWDTLARIDSPEGRDAALKMAAQASCDTGDTTSALAFARRIESGSLKAKALGSIGLTLVRSGQRVEAEDVGREALDVATMIREDGSKAVALCAIADALVNIGDRSKATEVIDAAERCAGRVEGSERKVRAFGRIAAVHADMGEHDAVKRYVEHGLASIDHIVDPYVRASGLTKFADSLAKVGDSVAAESLAKRALALARPARPPGQFLAVLDPGFDLIESSKAAAALARGGCVEQAVSVAPDLLARAEEYGRKSLRPDDLLMLGDRLQDRIDAWNDRRMLVHASATAQLAIIWYAAGDQPRATEIIVQARVAADAIRDPESQAAASIAVARSMIEMGAETHAAPIVLGARKAARQITAIERRTSTLGQLAPLLLRCVGGDEAVAVWKEAVTHAYRGGRSSAFDALDAGAAIIGACDGSKGLWTLYETIVELERWWGAE